MTTKSSPDADDGPDAALACAALSPGLRSILVYDAAPDELRALAVTLARMLQATTDQDWPIVQLGASTSDDMLWGGFTLQAGRDEKGPFGWRDGLLRGRGEDPSPRIVLLPDLTRLPLAVARAILLLTDAPVAHLERYGQHESWRPNLCWLAACPRSAVGQVSPHLVDRFVLRMNGRDIPRADHLAELRREFSGAEAVASPPLPLEALRTARTIQPEVADDARDQALRYYPKAAYGMRRVIALMRLSVAYARLNNIARVSADVVDQAAPLTALQPLRKAPKAPVASDTPPSAPSPNPDPSPMQSAPVAPAPRGQQAPPVPQETLDQVVGPETVAALPSVPLAVSALASAHPEDVAPVQREAASLRLPIGSMRARRLQRGAIVGVERANDLNDLALVSTLLEAAKFQAMRQRNGIAKPGEIRILPADWRRYRRVPWPEHLLVLVLDYSSLSKHDTAWETAVASHLHSAYVSRAGIRVVQIGGSGDDLRARLVRARSLLALPFQEAFTLRPCKATPLAHGLELALQTMRHALQQGRSPVLHCRLLVLSDGRGNVPLAVSRQGEPPRHGSRDGMSDALKMAHLLASLDRVEAILLNPQPREYPELPHELARALAAKVETIQQESERKKDDVVQSR